LEYQYLLPSSLAELAPFFKIAPWKHLKRQPEKRWSNMTICSCNNIKRPFFSREYKNLKRQYKMLCGKNDLATMISMN
jgi:hypothetical protein